MKQKINWSGTEQIDSSVSNENKIKTTNEEKLIVLQELIEKNKNLLEETNTFYLNYFTNSDLGSVVGRLEQNIIQLKKIKLSLLDV